MIKFQAKAIYSIDELNEKGIVHEGGYVKGYLVGRDWLVGDVIEATEEYIVLEQWIKIDENTLTQVDLFETLRSD